ncbi:MAG TPA: winged helix-turn-helix transcriptional regulator [Solirubrobacterales bacterium]|nr:winged helix-turn-helix transcriptional regulator [Solirubrobacterales bacterium]
MRGGADTQDEPRAGARILELLANPLNSRILRALANGPLRLADLHERTAWPAQTTLRAAIVSLRELGLLERVEVSRMPLGVANGLTGAGRETLFVTDVVERWLARGPQGPIPIDSDAAKAAIKALAGGWSSTMVRALAEEPASLTELDRLIPEMSYPSLERRLSRMRSTRQVEPSPANGRGQPFGATDWLRHSVAPLCAAGRCERRHMKADSAPITPVEIEAAFLLALPIAPLPETAEGVCALTVPAEGESSSNGRHSLAGVVVEVRAGQLIRCESDLNSGGPTWALGAPVTWMDAVIEGHLDALRFGGTSPQLAVDLVHGLHVGLFGE